MPSTKSLAYASILALALTGCVNIPIVQTGTYVAPLPASDADVLARAMTNFLRDRLPPAASTLALVAPPSLPSVRTSPNAPHAPPTKAAVDPLTRTLLLDLKAAGFALAAPAQKIASAHVIQYVVEPFSDGMLLTMKIDGYSASQCFVRNTAGALQPSSPFSVEEASHE